MRTILTLLIGGFLSALPAQEKETLINIGGQEIPVEDFMWMYRKSSQSAVSGGECLSMEDYLVRFWEANFLRRDANDLLAARKRCVQRLHHRRDCRQTEVHSQCRHSR